MSKMLRIHKFGDVSGLRLDEVTVPAPRRGEAKIRVAATGITGDQLTFIRGSFHPGEPIPPLPATIGYEAAGTVEEVGEGVDRAWIGRKVAPVGPYDFLTYGSVGEEILVPADRLVEIPEGLSSAQAASLWIPYLTAYPIVEHLRGSDKGGYVLITAATSTVGHAAIQLVRHLGFEPIGTTRSAEKAEALKKLTGIKEVIVTTEENLVERVDAITGGQGVRLVFDPIGGKSITDLAAMAAPGAAIVEYGVIGGMEAPLPVPLLLGKGLSIEGFAVNQISDNPARRAEAVDYLLDGVRQGWLSPLVAQTFDLEDFEAAYRQLQKNDKLGRVVLTVSR